MSLHLVEDQRITAAVLLPSLQHFMYELIINALEADATSIQVTISKDVLICKDNGNGIEDLQLIGTKGATSKSNHRGNALYSMSVLSELEITTKCANEKVGLKKTKKGISHCAFNNGTQVHLSNIYHNLTVRSKYLQQHFAVELSKCIDLMQTFCCLYPIEWIFDKITNNKTQRVVMYKKESNLLNRLSLLFHNSLEPFEVENASGYISIKEVKETKLCIIYNDIPLMLNFEKHKNIILLKKVLKEAYKSVSFRKYVVILTIYDSYQFLTESTVRHLVQLIANELKERQESLQQTCFQTQSTLSSDLIVKGNTENEDVRELGPCSLIKTESKLINTLKSTDIAYLPTPCCANFGDLTSADIVDHELKISDFKEMDIVGQFNLGFILCIFREENKRKLYIIDQHASHEIYNYEMLLKEMTIEQYPLLLPKHLKLNPSERLLFQKYQTKVASFGFEFIINDNEYYMTVIPVYNGVELNENDLFDILSQFDNDNSTVVPLKLKHKMASKACRSSIMIGDALTRQEMIEIVHNLSNLKKPWNCPHGRPTVKLLKGFE